MQLRVHCPVPDFSLLASDDNFDLKDYYSDGDDSVDSRKEIRIKFEIDTNPPEYGGTE